LKITISDIRVSAYQRQLFWISEIMSAAVSYFRYQK